MKIKLSPVYFDMQPMIVFTQGDSLNINGLTLDFSQLPEGATLPAQATNCPWLIGPIERVGGELVVTLLLPIPENASHAARFPADIVAPGNGRVSLPIPDAEAPPSFQGYAAIDWDQLITQQDKAQAAEEELVATAASEIALRRTEADTRIAPLQDAVELEEATEIEAVALKNWKRYRIALNRLPDQPGYPASIEWPTPPL